MLRPFDPTKDRDATIRIWDEVGWLEFSSEEIVNRWVDAGRAMVAEVAGEAECLVCTAPGTVAYQNEALPASLFTGVTTSRVARKQGLALRVTARCVMEGVQDGAIVAALGMFEQGFYNQVGFGSGSYEIAVTLDPARLNVPGRHRTPERLTKGDSAVVHAARLARPAAHGNCTVFPEVGSWGPMNEGKGFGLGYRDKATGELTHHFWCKPRGEHGPYRIAWMVYHNREQFLELLSVIRSIGDQVRAIKIPEPADIQLQDMMQQPFKQIQISDKSGVAAGIDARAHFQYRICDLAACMARTHLPGERVTFNLELTDPIATHLPEDSAWRGIAGIYRVTLGPESESVVGHDAGLPTLHATVGAFTRLWLGVKPATGLSLTDDLSGPSDLLSQLDRLIRLPTPRNDWDY